MYDAITLARCYILYILHEMPGIAFLPKLGSDIQITYLGCKHEDALDEPHTTNQFSTRPIYKYVTPSFELTLHKFFTIF
jgi:hypothetical protein